MDEQDFCAKMTHSIKQAKEGKVIRQLDFETIDDFVNRVLSE